jgi:3-methyladenine DNA glycosylase AlkD
MSSGDGRGLEGWEGSLMSTTTMLTNVMAALAALEEPKMREANERRGDDHGVNLTHLRALAKRLKTQQDLALQLWATGDTAARLLATLVCKPKSFAAAELDVMIHGIRSPKLLVLVRRERGEAEPPRGGTPRGLEGRR